MSHAVPRRRRQRGARNLAGGPYERGQIRKYIGTGGELGHLPGWFLVDKAARYYGVPRWDLLAQPDAGLLISQAITAISGENEGLEDKAQYDAQRARTSQK